MILEALQGPAGSDAPPVGKSVHLPGGQEALNNSSTMGAGNLTEVDALLGNKKSGGKDKIAAEIKQLKKKQKSLR